MQYTLNKDFKSAFIFMFLIDVSYQAIAPDQDISLIGMDSFRFVKLTVQIEMHFDIEMDDDSLLFENMSTIEKMADVIYHQLSNA